MTRILIAADESDSSVEAARVAHRLFGDSAEYLVINVAEPTPDASMAWAYVYPATMPMMAFPPATADDPVAQKAAETSETVATDVATKASIAGAEPLTDTGDAATAILDAAHRHQVDVVVIGSHERSWFSRLLAPSVSSAVLRESDIPVLIVK